jgi:hypothetical protein
LPRLALNPVFPILTSQVARITGMSLQSPVLVPFVLKTFPNSLALVLFQNSIGHRDIDTWTFVCFQALCHLHWHTLTPISCCFDYCGLMVDIKSGSQKSFQWTTPVFLPALCFTSRLQFRVPH